MKINLQFDEGGDCWLLKPGEKHHIKWEHPLQLAEVILGKEVDSTYIIDIYTREAEVMQVADISDSKSDL